MKASWILAAMIVAMMAFQLMGLDPGIIRGIGYDDLFRGAVIALLVLEIAFGARLRIEAPGIHVAFILWIGYAILSWLFVGLVLDYEGYKTIGSGMKIKRDIIDYYLTFLVFFYGVRTLPEARWVLNILIGVVLIANLLSVADTLGFIALNLTVIDGERVQGIMYEANQTGALIAAFMPAMVVLGAKSKALWRVFWFGGVAILLAALLLAASRGGVAGIIGSLFVAGYIFRRQVSIGRIIIIAGGVGLLVVLILLSLNTEFRSILVERFIGQSTATGAADLTSGRTDIWGEALGRMSDSPLSFLTGMGWNAYVTFPFKRAPHNTYLGIWFDLGVIGVLCVVAIFATAVRRLRNACDVASKEDQILFVGMGTGLIGFAISIMFVDVHQPWLYLYALIALALRIAIETYAEIDRTQVKADAPAASRRKDPYGWRSSAQAE